MSEQVIRYMTPAVTPLLPNGELDLESCKNLYRHLLDGGVDGVLILGSIGEFFGLTIEQKKALIRCSAEMIGGHRKLIVGTTSMIFSEIVELSNYALEQGVDGVMIISRITCFAAATAVSRVCQIFIPNLLPLGQRR